MNEKGRMEMQTGHIFNNVQAAYSQDEGNLFFWMGNIYRVIVNTGSSMKCQDLSTGLTNDFNPECDILPLNSKSLQYATAVGLRGLEGE